MIGANLAVFASLVGTICSFQLGVKHVYDYENRVQIYEKEQSENEGNSPRFQLEAQVHFTSVWESPKSKEQLVKVEIVRPSLEISKKDTFKKQQSAVDSLDTRVVYFHLVEDNIERIYHSQKDLSQSSLNKLLTGIFDLLQHLDDKPSECTISSSIEGNTRTVVKGCVDHDKPKRRTHYIQSANVLKTTSFKYAFDADKNVLQSADVTEAIQLSANMWKNDKLTVQSRVNLKLIEELSGMPTVFSETVSAAIESIKNEDGEIYVEEKYPIKAESNFDVGKCDLFKTIKSHKKNLKSENLSKVTSASTFSKLLKCFRIASKQDIENVLKAKEFSNILPQLLDAVAFAGTKDSVEAAFSVLEFAKTDSLLLERYLLALSVVPYATEEMIQAVMRVLDTKGKALNDETQATLLITLGALTRSYTLSNRDSQQIVQSVEEFFRNSVGHCKTESCFFMNLRGLRNAAMPITVPLLLTLAEKGGKTAHEALLALKKIGFQRSSPSCEKFSEKIFYETRQREDTSNRIVAAEILLQCYTKVSTLGRLLAALADQKQHEMSTLIASMISQKMKDDGKFRSDVVEALKDPKVKHYYALAQRGSSVSFDNLLMPFLVSPGVNATYNVQVELMSVGVMKKCSVDINIDSPDGELPLMSVGAVTEGLESMVSDQSGDPDAVPTAAVDLSVLGTSLRPKVLFSGTTHLMGLVFSGAGSERTPILQGNYLVIDFSDELNLLGGLSLRLGMEGIVSNDLSGSIQISLWSRNSQSEIIESFAGILKGTLAVETDFVVLKEELSVKLESAITFLSDSDFYEEPYKMCVQMMHPELSVRSQKKLLLSVPGRKAFRKKLKKKKWSFPSKSYFLNKKNNDMCGAMSNINH